MEVETIVVWRRLAVFDRHLASFVRVALAGFWIGGRPEIGWFDVEGRGRLAAGSEKVRQGALLRKSRSPSVVA